MRELHRRTCACWIFSSSSVISSATVVNMSPSSATCAIFFIVSSKSAHSSVRTSKACMVFLFTLYTLLLATMFSIHVELKLTFLLLSSWSNSPSFPLVTANGFSPSGTQALASTLSFILVLSSALCTSIPLFGVIGRVLGPVIIPVVVLVLRLNSVAADIPLRPSRIATFGPIFLSRRSPFLAVAATPRVTRHLTKHGQGRRCVTQNMK